MWAGGRVSLQSLWWGTEGHVLNHKKKTLLRATRRLGCKNKPPYACQLTHPLLLKKKTAHPEEDSMLVEFTPLHPNGSSSSSSARPPARRRRRPVDVLSALSNHALGTFIWDLATKYCAAAFAPTRSTSSTLEFFSSPFCHRPQHQRSSPPR